MNYIEILQEQFLNMGRSFVALLPNLAIALVVILITALVAKSAVRIAGKLIGRAKVRPDLKSLAETAVRLAIWIVGLLAAAAVAIPGFTPAGVIAGLGIGALAIGFAFQDIFENFLAGVLIMLRDKMNLGDYIEADGIDGTVEKITLRETHIRQFSGELTILPNSTIFKNPVKIYSDQPKRRFDLAVGVSYDTDLPKAERVIRAAVEAVSGIDADHGVEVWAREFGASSVDFIVRWWVNTQQDSLFQVHHDVVFAVKQALDDAEIEIPFPYVTHTFKEQVQVEQIAEAA